MESPPPPPPPPPPATMAKEPTAGAMPPFHRLPEVIAIWEILVRLPPKSLARCRAVCRAWRRATSNLDFLLAHHGRQPSLPLVWGELVSGAEYGGRLYDEFLAFDHRAADAKLQPVARIDESYRLETSRDGLLILSDRRTTGTRLSICNPVTREHSPLGTPPWDFSAFNVLGMYRHPPSGEYRLLLHRRTRSIAGSRLPDGEIGCYVLALSSDQPPRYIGGLDGPGPDAAFEMRFTTPALVRDSLHWFPRQRKRERRLVLVFDTKAESFRRMRAPVVHTKSNIFEMDDTLGIYSYDDAMKVVHIWALQDYQGEVWKYKYGVELPVAEISAQIGLRDDHSNVGVGSGHGDVLLLLSYGEWMFSVSSGGELVDKFHRDGQHIYPLDHWLKQTLVPHNFFTALEGYAVKDSPFL